eukprot:1161015-Pelagomonas_calceolata.AAC.6
MTKVASGRLELCLARSGILGLKKYGGQAGPDNLRCLHPYAQEGACAQPIQAVLEGRVLHSGWDTGHTPEGVAHALICMR